ncbi:MAG: cupin domain-containing protein [Oscillospiraceae bacterium]|nr:cupin domain-containing protein [Oscillospiraceae bacterium]
MNRNNQCNCCRRGLEDADRGPEPFVTDIRCAAAQNTNFRTALWTGGHLQLTLMCIPQCGEIGLEIHTDTDQFLQIEEGCGLVLMGAEQDFQSYQKEVGAGCAVFVPAGTWHNLINTGDRPLKLLSIYAPPHHPHGVIHCTKSAADHDEHDHY